MSGIPLDVPGRPLQIREAAEWLDPAVAEVSRQAFDSALNRRTDAAQHWFGPSADLYMEHMDELVDAAMEVRRWAQDVAEKLRSYAGQLERMASDFADYEVRAEQGDLRVLVQVVQPPVEPADSADQDAFDAYDAKVNLFNRIAEDVATRWHEHDEWVEEHLNGFRNTIPTVSEAEQRRENLLTFLQTSAGAGFELSERGSSAYVAQLVAEAAELRVGGEQFRAMLAQNDAIAASLSRLQHPDIEARYVDSIARDFRRWGRAVPVLGVVAEALFIGIDLASGRDPIEVFIEAGGSVAGGLGAAALLAAAVGTAPFWVTAGTVVAGGIAGGAIAVGIWNAAVPQDVREDWQSVAEDWLFDVPVRSVP